MLYDYLVNNYEKGEPIFLMDIVVKGMTEENIRYHLKKMTDEGIIDRFDSGIYYIPKINIFGEKSTISAETVALHKYVSRRGKRVGFYSGYTLANRLGLSTQVPIKEEITSNYAPAQVREVSIKNQKYLIRRPAVTITEENAYVLQLLDCLKDIDKSAEEDKEILYYIKWYTNITNIQEEIKMTGIKNMDMSKVLVLKDEVAYQPGQVVSKTLAQNEHLSVTLFAFDKGEEISTHESGGDAFVTCLDGVGKITIDGVDYELHEGESIVMPAKHPHAVFGKEQFKMLLVVVF